MLRFFGLALAALLLLGFSVWALGASLPVQHSAQASVHLASSKETVWSLVRDFESYSAWRNGVEEVSRVASASAETWQETGSQGALKYMVVEEEPLNLLVTKIVDNPDFGGTWSILLVEEKDGVSVTIRENGEVYSPVFRFFARYVLGYDTNLRQYLADLEEVARLPGASDEPRL